MTVALEDHPISVEAIKEQLLEKIRLQLAKPPESATQRDWWRVTCKVVHEQLVGAMLDTQQRHYHANARRIYYLSMEYLMGRLLANNLHNAKMFEAMREALAELGQDVEEIIEEEYDMGLGNGGLGRLAACFLDSMANLDLPAIGYGIRYEFGLFKQEFDDGYQVEHPDSWMPYGDIWDIVRPEHIQDIQVYGEVQSVFNDRGEYKPKWINGRAVRGVPYDIPICGYELGSVNFLRLWESKATSDIDFDTFNEGSYDEALRQKNENETISKILYPNDETENGKELRLVQQYFFVTCSLKDIVRRYQVNNEGWEHFPEKVCVQLNDTHPAIAVAELMRILHDEHELPWEEAWDRTTRTFAYTNHTLLPEALERWSVPLFTRVLPRHIQLIMEINVRFLEQVKKQWPGDESKIKALSLIEEGRVQHVRMAHLAVVGSFSVNGVAALHTRLLRRNLFSDFDEMYPGKFNNKTNGITPRRWLLSINPGLSNLITEKIGDAWIKDLDHLRDLEPHREDAEFRARYMGIKHANKERLATIIQDLCGVTVSPHALFDVQIKRLHEYKRQHLNLLHILSLYHQLLKNPDLDIHPRVFVFGAKAAPGYVLAKTIIKAINAAGSVINNDPRIQDKLKIAFLPNYRVSLASKIIPAADLSEQISTAGKEASGTGNMKLALNGALTIGTLDGANVEILEEVGAENIFIFGKTVEEVEALWKQGYHPQDILQANEHLRTLVEWVGSDYFTPGEHNVLQDLKNSWAHGDPYLCLADFDAYCASQLEVDSAYRNQDHWAKMAILNTARMGKFSSDRSIADYNRDIWKLDPQPKASR
jgi:glycogen phosphorylase